MPKLPLRHGVFLPPFHPMDENPAACLDRDLELMEWLDRLGFHEAWIGEHHSAGWELISSPELFIAVASQRTRSIRFGTGVISLPYHNPLMVANRIIQLDHHTRGRVMFGAGPGLLASDALMLGIDPNTQRDRMAEALDVILRLFRGEIVTEKTDWYTLVDARAHLLPYTKPHPEVAVVSAVTPSGGRLAGKYDLSMICVAATNPFGYDALAANWKIANDIAATQGRRMDPARLRLVGPMHIAETRAKAFENVRFGFERYLDYLNNNQPRFLVPDGTGRGGMVRGPKIRRDRHARRRHRADRTALRQTRRVRRHAAPGAQLGRLGRNKTLLRALRPLRHAALLRRQRPPYRFVRLVHRTSRRADRETLHRGACDVRQARGRATRGADGAPEDRAGSLVNHGNLLDDVPAALANEDLRTLLTTPTCGSSASSPPARPARRDSGTTRTGQSGCCCWPARPHC